VDRQKRRSMFQGIPPMAYMAICDKTRRTRHRHRDSGRLSTGSCGTCMPEPLSLNRAWALKVTVLLYFLATFLMTYLYLSRLSAICTRGEKTHVDFRLPSCGHFMVLGLDQHTDLLQGQHHFAADVLLAVRGRKPGNSFLVADFVSEVRVLHPAGVPATPQPSPMW